MISLPGGVLYEPVDFGFNAAPIAASAQVVGNLVPWVSKAKIVRVIFFLIKAGTASSFTLRATAQTPTGVALTSGFNSFWQTVTATSSVWFDDNNPRAGDGTPIPGALPFIFGSPLIQIRIDNNDAVNPGTATLFALLGS